MKKNKEELNELLELCEKEISEWKKFRKEIIKKLNKE